MTTTAQLHADAPVAAASEEALVAAARPRNQRLNWIDCAKGIGIVLVVYGHVWGGLVDAGIQSRSRAAVTVVSIVYTFHMPVFFCVAGFWLARTVNRPISRLMADKAGTILYPYLIWSVIQMSVNMAAAPYTNQAPRPSDLLGIVYRPYAQFWFLYILFIDVTVAALLLRHRLGRSLLALAAAVLYSSANYWVQSPWPIGAQMSTSFLFVAAGALLGPGLTSDRFANGSRVHNGLTCLACLAVLLMVYFTLPDAHWIRPALTGALGVAFVLGASRSIAGTVAGRIFEILGSRSLEIYVMHVIAAAGIRIALARGVGITGNVPHLILGMAGGLLLPFAAATIIARARLPFFKLRGENDRKPESCTAPLTESAGAA